MRRSRRSITIQDVARTAGVSVSTVSRVLNNKDDVAVETVEKIQAVIKELRYTSSLAARGMRSHRTNVIGLIMPDVSSPYAFEVMQGVNDGISRLGYDLLVLTNGDFRRYQTAEREQHYVMLLNGGITDGVIVVAGATNRFPTNSPVVIIDPKDISNSHDQPSIIGSNYGGVRSAIAYLVELGHRRIGTITGQMQLISAGQRLQGYKDGLAAAGIPLDEALIQPGDFNQDTAEVCARALLSLQPRPTAIFAANDMSAIGVYNVAREMGLRIPEDLSVVGFDNLRDASSLNPPLTTVDQHVRAMGSLAVEMLVKLLNGETLENNPCTMETRLVVRASCSPLLS